MAKHLTVKTVRQLLQSRSSISDDAFRILQFLCQQANQEPNSEITLELILLALERRRAFRDHEDILDALVRTVGLYPYADREQLDTRDLLAYEFHRPISSGSQLAYKLWHLYGKTTRQLVDEEMQSSRTELTPSESVERVLDFERHWAGYEAPRMLMALSSIQKIVFGNADLPYGDYSVYAALLGNVFRGRSAGALDEYGVPLEMSGRLMEEIDLDDDLDSVLSRLKEYIPDRRTYSEFELDVLKDVQSGL